MASIKKSKNKKSKKKIVNGDSALVNFEATKKDREAFEARAKRFTKGNVSAWLRLAGTKFRPDLRTS